MQSKSSYTLEEATKKLENYCGYQERCHLEVKQKLKNLNMIPQAIDVIMAHLIEQNYLNEERFAKTFVSGKFRIKKWGKRRLALELKKREVSKMLINKYLAEISDSVYLNTFNALAEKKVSSLKDSNLIKKKKKFADYFLYRGWESHLVYDKANELIK